MPETKPIDALLQELQHSRNHMVVVLDEYGGVSGLVTMEDVLEEIVGEIVDEYDPAHVEGVHEYGPGVCEAMGRVHIDEINERLGPGTARGRRLRHDRRLRLQRTGARPHRRRRPDLAKRPHYGSGRHAAADRAGADRSPRCGRLANLLGLRKNNCADLRRHAKTRNIAMSRRGLIFFALLAAGVGLARPAQAAVPKVNDQARFFSQTAVDSAMQKMQRLYRDYKVEIIVETFASIPQDMRGRFDSAKTEAEKNGFFEHWAANRVRTKQ